MKIIFIIILLIISFNVFSQKTGSFRDPRDRNEYKTIRVGGTTWMAENLNYRIRNDSRCYQRHPTACRNFGRLYNQKAATRACPDGWRLPYLDDWVNLLESFGYRYHEEDSKRMQTISYGRIFPRTNKEYLKKEHPNFGIQFGGYYNPSMDVFVNIHSHGKWWLTSNSSDNPGDILIREEFGVIWLQERSSSFWKSIRCIKNEL